MYAFWRVKCTPSINLSRVGAKITYAFKMKLKSELTNEIMILFHTDNMI